MADLRRVAKVLVLFSWDERLCLRTARLEEIGGGGGDGDDGKLLSTPVAPRSAGQTRTFHPRAYLPGWPRA